jgi:hypothetical protein
MSPAGLKTIFYFLNFWDSPNLESQVPVFISPRNMVALLHPETLGSLLSPLTTRRAAVDVFCPASTREGSYGIIQIVCWCWSIRRWCIVEMIWRRVQRVAQDSNHHKYHPISPPRQWYLRFSTSYCHWISELHIPVRIPSFRSRKVIL